MNKNSLANKLKQNKAITLIALVITIVVLLILAGVTISAISGNESIMGKAQEAVKKTEETVQMEQLRLDYIEILTKNNLEQLSASELQNELVNNYDLDVSVVEYEMYCEDTSNLCFSKEYEGSKNNYSKDSITKVLKLQGIENADVKKEKMFLITFNKEFKWYRMNKAGEVKLWNPVCLVNCKTSKNNSKDAINVNCGVCYKPRNYTYKEFGLLYGTNKLLGADTSVENYAIIPFSYEYLDKNLRFSDDTYTTPNKSIKKSVYSKNANSYDASFQELSYAVGGNIVAYTAYRGYAIYENNYTHERKIFYTEPLYVTYNIVKALE